jgi:ATP-dependent DNA helicase RecQ
MELNTESEAVNQNFEIILKSIFGFDSFRPLQREIVEDFLSGKDVFALLPTGGGKSLCFQLPALIRPGLTVVVSPLIALMKDQVDGLQSAGIKATYLNSSLDGDEARERLRDLYQGQYRILYVAPERLVMPEFIERLKLWQVSAFAIDEAHCISEWGHDFRPEYRKLSMLRSEFPGLPVMALTATATGRVRDDIIAGLSLRVARHYVASFNRPNLSYRVVGKEKGYQKILDFIQSKEGESGIVYCQSRKSVEALAEKLVKDGIKARPYHAGLDGALRAKNQELFLRDEIQVICATVAFGMGINKPNVRFVIHQDLPKNIEGYYQETGRAGRDGLPGECLLLFSSVDVVKYQRFMLEIADPQQRQVARAQLQQMVHYAESSQCRRKMLLDYFGEIFKPVSCESCDNCLSPKDSFDGSKEVQMFLSCIYRIKEMSRFSVGLNHVVEVLTGADTEKVRQWDHQKLSTYGIGKGFSRSEWLAIGRELIRLGLVSQNAQKFGVLEITDIGKLTLKERREVVLTRPEKKTETKDKKRIQKSTGDFDTDLFARLRALRKSIADQRKVPPYIIFGDVSLRQMALDCPVTNQQFSNITGVGAKKLADFGTIFMREIAAFLQEQGKGPKPHLPKDLKLEAQESDAASDTVEESLALYEEGKNLAEIATARGLTVSTVMNHLITALGQGEALDIRRFISVTEEDLINEAFMQAGSSKLKVVKEILGERISYEQLHLYRAFNQQ